jgi:hypothetical protein
MADGVHRTAIEWTAVRVISHRWQGSNVKPMRGSPLRVLLASGGIAGLETSMALRELAGARAQLTPAAADDEFVYRPVTIGQPYSVGAARSVALPRAAEEAGSAFVAATLERVDTKTRNGWR